MKKNRLNRRISAIALFIIVLIYIFWTLLPYYWMFVTSLKEQGEMYSFHISLWPKNPSLVNYKKLLSDTLFLTYFKNSFIVTSITTVIGLVISILAAFAISKFKFKGREIISQSVFFVYLLPEVVLIIPLYLLMSRLNLIDSLWSLIITFPITIVPFCTWMLIGYFSSIPQEVIQAAEIDGCTRMKTLFKIILPLSIPGVVATWIFSFVNAWNQYLIPLVLTSRDTHRLLPVGLTMFMTQDVFFWGPLMAASILTTLPTIILFIIVQRFTVQGLTAGAVKG